MRGAIRLLLALALLLCVIIFAGGRPFLWGLLTDVIRLGHSEVAWITPGELHRGPGAGGWPPLLLDVRTDSEYATSHLPGAERLAPGAPLPPEVLALPRDTPIVVYCAVGYRSALAAEQLQHAGFTAVRNLEGGIFRWANRDFPLQARGHPASQVHPYAFPWSQLLRPELRAR